MAMDRESSHHHACSSHGMDCMAFKKSWNRSPLADRAASPRITKIQRNSAELALQDLLRLAKLLKYPGVTTLRLSVCPEDQPSVSQRFGSADPRTTDTLSVFIRALAHAIEGWMQNLELGLSLGLRDVNTLCPAIRSSTTLKHLSFANSGLGDVTLQVLSSCLQHCQSLQTLNLSGCALTDAAASIVSTIVKGEDPNARPVPQNTKKAPAAEHRAPKYGQQWRQNVILMGKWSPAPDLEDNLITPKTEVDWQTTLRQSSSSASLNHYGIIGCKPGNNKSANSASLIGLDLSYNSFTDALSEELCPILHKKPPLRALNLRCNQMTRAGAKPLLDVMKEVNILRLVDIRGNADEGLLGVLENGEHYTTFSTYQSPFWMDAESLDPVLCTRTKSQSTTPANSRARFTPSSALRSSIPEKQTKATIASQHVTIVRDGAAESHNQSPQNRCNRSLRGGGSRNNTPSGRGTKTPPKARTSSPQINITPSCNGTSGSRTPADHWGPGARQKRYHCSHRESQYVNNENEDLYVCNDHTRRCSLAPGKERPTLSSGRVGPQRSVWPEKTTFVDQTTLRHITPPSREQDLDTRFVSPATLEPPRDHPIWDTPTLHDLDMREIHTSSKFSDNIPCRRLTTHYEGPRRAESAGYNTHRRGIPRDRDHNNSNSNHHDFYREYGHQNCYRNFSASQSPLRSWPSYSNQGNQQQGKRSPEKSPVIRCHHRCKLLNEVQEQKRNRSRVARAAWLEEQGRMPCPHPSAPQIKAASLSDDKKELVEWNNFVNQMTNTLLNLKDGLNKLIGPHGSGITEQAAHKSSQVRSSFFRSGMLRLLERSCKVLNSHVTMLTKRHKENLRHMNNSENQAPVVNGECPKKGYLKVTGAQEAVAQHEKQFDRNLKALRNVKQLGPQHHSNHQHRMIYHPNLPPLTTSKGTNIPAATKV